MSTGNRKIAPWGFVFSILLGLSLTACGSSTADQTPTPGVEAIFTAAYQTFEAQQATELAMTPPTEIPSPTLFPTLPAPSPVATLSFGSATASSGGTGCNNSTYVSDVSIPDDTVIDAGAGFDKTWQLLNSGTCEWTTSYKLAFSSGDQMSGETTSITVPVPSGSVVDITVPMVAPQDAGTYKGNWQMQNDQGQFFGNIIYVQIKVGSVTETPISSDDLTATAEAP
ncbi:MAG: NBR1-Ig-like domain-containing protein [Anaerolineales bacterium]